MMTMITMIDDDHENYENHDEYEDHNGHICRGEQPFCWKLQLSDITHSNTGVTFLTATLKTHYAKQQLDGTKTSSPFLFSI